MPPRTLADPVSPGAHRAIQNRGVKAALDRAAGLAAEAGRADLVEGLHRQRLRLDAETFQVLVAGEFGRGKSALINGLLGVPVCGVSAATATAVPTFIRYGRRATARLAAFDGTRDATADQARPAAVSVPVPVAEVPRLTLQQNDPRHGRYSGVEVELPRRLLSDGLVLVDSSGIGAGFAAATSAATTLRALSGADALLLVTDASAELSASEVEFIGTSLSLCPVAACIVTKIDLYPRWRQIVDLDREYLAGAGFDLPVLPVSSVLHDLWLDTGDPALLAESGFPVLTTMLNDDFRREHRSSRCRVAVSEARATLQMVAGQLQAEVTALRDPASRARQLEELRATEKQAARMYGASARWQEVLADEFRTLRREVPRDLDDRFRVVREDARRRITEGTPERDWPDLDAWLLRTVNQASLAHHHLVLERIRAAAAVVAAQFDVELERLPFAVPLQPRRGDDPAPRDAAPSPRASRLEMVLGAARGFTLGGSVLAGLLTVNHLVPLAVGAAVGLVSVPIAAAVAATAGVLVGATATIRAVSTTRQATLQKVQAALQQNVDTYIAQAQGEARRLDDDVLDLAFVNLRDHFKEVSERMLHSAKAAVEAAAGITHLNEGSARTREQQLAQRLNFAHRLDEALGSALPAAR